MGGRGGSSGRGWSAILGSRGKSASVEEALSRTNPHYREGREWQQNCQRCIFAYEMQRRGYDVEAKPRIFDGTDRLPYMHDRQGWAAVMENATLDDMPSRNTEAAMARKMAEYGEGSRAVVRVTWKGRRSGHVFIAEQTKTGTRYVDPQSGREIKVSSYLNEAIKGETKLMRVDNLKPTALIEKCVSIRKKG